MTINDYVGLALSIGVLGLAAVVTSTVFYFGTLALIQTIGDIWRWVRGYLLARHLEREERLQEEMRAWTR